MNNLFSLKIRKEWFFIIGISISFNVMLTNYLFEFDSGAVNGGDSLRFILKIISIFLIMISQPFPNKLIIKKNLLLILSFFFFLFSYIIFFPFSTWNDFQFLNMFFVIFLLFGIGYNHSFLVKLNKILIYIFLFIWLPTDLYAIFSGNNLWENKAFIGGIGNPSSYGMIMIYLILMNKGFFNPIIEILINFLLFFSLFLTQALMPILIMFVLSFFLFKKRHILFFLIIFTFLFYTYFNYILESLGLQDIHWFLKLQALTEYGFSSSNNSGSVFYRLEYFKDIYKLFDNPFVFLFGHVNSVSYNGGDSQYISYLTSFGFPMFLFFIFSMFKIIYDIKFFVTFRLKLFFSAFFLILITNRYLDYWPNAIIVFFIINYIGDSINTKSFLRIKS